MRMIKSTTAAIMKAAAVTTTTTAMEMDATTHTNTPARDRYPRLTVNAAQSSYASATSCVNSNMRFSCTSRVVANARRW